MLIVHPSSIGKYTLLAHARELVGWFSSPFHHSLPWPCALPCCLKLRDISMVRDTLRLEIILPRKGKPGPAEWLMRPMEVVTYQVDTGTRILCVSACTGGTGNALTRPFSSPIQCLVPPAFPSSTAVRWNLHHHAPTRRQVTTSFLTSLLASRIMFEWPSVHESPH